MCYQHYTTLAHSLGSPVSVELNYLHVLDTISRFKCSMYIQVLNNYQMLNAIVVMFNIYNLCMLFTLWQTSRPKLFARCSSRPKRIAMQASRPKLVSRQASRPKQVAYFLALTSCTVHVRHTGPAQVSNFVINNKSLNFKGKIIISKICSVQQTCK